MTAQVKLVNRKVALTRCVGKDEQALHIMVPARINRMDIPSSGTRGWQVIHTVEGQGKTKFFPDVRDDYNGSIQSFLKACVELNRRLKEAPPSCLKRLRTVPQTNKTNQKLPPGVSGPITTQHVRVKGKGRTATKTVVEQHCFSAYIPPKPVFGEVLKKVGSVRHATWRGSVNSVKKHAALDKALAIRESAMKDYLKAAEVYDKKYLKKALELIAAAVAHAKAQVKNLS